MANQVVLMEPLHDDDDRAFGLVVESAEKRIVEPGVCRLAACFGQGLIGLELLRGHVGTVPAVDDQRLFSTEPARRSRSVNRRIAAPVNDDAATKTWRIAGFDVVQQCDGVDDACGIARRDVCLLYTSDAADE